MTRMQFFFRSDYLLKIKFNFHEITSMYQCIFIHILCRRGCNLMDIFFRCDRSIRSTSIIFEFLFVLLEHKIFYTSTMGLMRIHTLIINLIIIWREKKKLFWQYYIDDIIQKMVKKLGLCVWILEYILSVRTSHVK